MLLLGFKGPFAASDLVLRVDVELGVRGRLFRPFSRRINPLRHYYPSKKVIISMIIVVFRLFDAKKIITI